MGITETKINDSNAESAEFSLPGYEFEFVPTPLAFGGVGMFIDETLHYTILEKQCILVKSDEPTLYISFKSWLYCCSLPTVAPQQWKIIIFHGKTNMLVLNGKVSVGKLT